MNPPEDRHADIIQEQEAKADARRSRFLVTITDTKTGMERSRTASDAFLALDLLRLDLRTPYVVLTGIEREPDDWSAL